MPAAADPCPIRHATDRDGPALAALIGTVFADYEGCPFVPEEFPDLPAVASAVRARGGAIWVAEAGGQVVGCLGVAPSHEARTAELFKVYLDRAVRGRGVAGRMVALAVDRARNAGARRLVAWSDTRFLEGHRFYERQGFARLPGLRALRDAGHTLEFGFWRAL